MHVTTGEYEIVEHSHELARAVKHREFYDQELLAFPGDASRYEYRLVLLLSRL